MKFGDYIKQCRTDKGWTQPEAAKRIDIEQSYLSKLETGKASPSEDVFERLAEVYEIDAQQLATLLPPEELDRLREIGIIRSMAIRYDRDIKKIAQSWLIAGLVLLAFGGGLIGLTQVEKGGKRNVFVYQSYGIVKPGEPPTILWDAGTDPNADTPPELLERIQEKSMTSFENKGHIFSQKVFGGRRIWRLTGGNEVIVPPKFSWAWPFGLGLIAAGFGCFYISRQWPGMHTQNLTA